MSGNPVQATVLVNRGRVESYDFTRALINAAASGLRTHCSDPDSRDLWLSEEVTERRKAARLCAGCPVLEPCHSAAEARGEKFGVWAGVDRTARPYLRKSAAT
jgi:hypothetical protein